MLSATVARSSASLCCRRSALSLTLSAKRNIQTTAIRRDSSFTNLLADDTPPAVQVSSISNDGIHLADGLLIPGACIFLEGKVFLWDVPDTGSLSSRIASERWKDWAEERFELFDAVLPRPGVLLF